MSHHLHTEIEIDAPPQTVWNILTDLTAYPQWNPFITSSEGTLAVGRRLINRLEPPGGKPVTFKPTITEIDHDRHVLEWLGRLGLPGVFDGRHRFELTPNQKGTKLIQTERFTGLLVPLLKNRLDTHTRTGFDTMNTALKTRAETLTSASRPAHPNPIDKPTR